MLLHGILKISCLRFSQLMDHLVSITLLRDHLITFKDCSMCTLL